LTSSTADDNDRERIEVLSNGQTIITRYLQVIYDAKSRWDYFADVKSLALPFLIESISEALSSAKSRGIKLRFITEITNDTISQSKEILPFGEVRHLEGVKGNFAVSNSEYIAISSTAMNASSKTPTGMESQSTTKTPHAVYSDVKEDIQQHQYVFESLWSKAIPAEDKIREIEEGIVPVRTRLLENQDEIIREIIRSNNSSTRLSVCSAFGGMQMAYNYLFDSYKNVIDMHRKEEGKGMRWIVKIDKENLNLVKIFLDAGIQIRHVNNMPPMNFSVSDKEMSATIEKMEGGRVSQSFLISNEPLYVNHFNSLFEELWNNGIDAQDRANDIEAGADLADIEVIQSSSRARELYLNLLKSAAKEILLVFASTGAFIRHGKIGVIELYREAARERNVEVRILMPADKSTEQTVQNLKQDHPGNTRIRYIEGYSATKATILLVDRKVSLVMELKDDSTGIFDEAIGLSTYSNSRSGVLSYVSIFENLWKQSELYEDIKKAHEQLKIHDKMQKEFISIASHELRTPVQSILGFASLANSGQIEPKEACVGVQLEADRLQQLTNNLLDASRIESGISLTYIMEEVKINEIILGVVNGVKVSLKEGVSIEAKLGGYGGRRVNNDNKDIDNYKDIEIYADKVRIIQAISNIVDNAIKFTDSGSIIVESNISIDKKRVEIKVTDSGIGIAQDILPNLFDKFVTKTLGNENKRGTGLGLYITKAIVGAHKGEIFGYNNNAGGATFTIVLPVHAAE
jgi:hypothetical protein